MAKRTKAWETRGSMCCVYGCSNRQYTDENTLSSHHFFRIPSKVLDSTKLTDRWCCLIKRRDGHDNFKVKQTTVICDKHFRKDDINISLVAKKWTLRDCAEPSIFSWTLPKPVRKPPKQRQDREPLSELSKEDFNFQGSVQHTNTIETQTEITLCTCDVSTQTDSSGVLGQIQRSEHDYSCRSMNLNDLDSQIDLLQSEIKYIQDKNRGLLHEISLLNVQVQEYKDNIFSLEKIKDDNSAMMFYTGFPNIDVFEAFYKYLSSKVEKLNYWRGRSEATDDVPGYQEDDKTKPGRKRKLSGIEELFIVLVRLKVGIFIRDVSDRFHISQGHFSKMFTTWINFLCFELQNLFPFPSQRLTRQNMPTQFEEYPTTRLIIDCTEIFVEIPSSMKVQSQTWSTYKHHNTFKVLVGVNPNGCLTFISKLWGGRVSDKEITLDSGVLDLLEPGDNLMADRGFDLAASLPEGVTLNIPPFLGGRSQFTAAEVTETMKIASVRIHVEREIGRIKNYHILDGVMPLILFHVADQIVKVCGYLTNFLPPLVPPANK